MFLEILLFVLGSVMGSFLSAVTYRIPLEISFIRGRSLCPHCKRKISWYDNIPLLSFLILGGKCRNCKKKISFRYPLIELVTGLGFLLIGLNIYYLFAFLLLEAILIIDLENQIIPDGMVFSLVTLAVLFLLFTSSPQIFFSLLAGFLAAAFLLTIHIVTKGRGMGLGDVKFAVAGGLLVGLKLSFVWLFTAFLTGGLVAFILILAKGAKLKDKIAFGPFLIAAIPIAILFGSEMLIYLGLV